MKKKVSGPWVDTPWNDLSPERKKKLAASAEEAKRRRRELAARARDAEPSPERFMGHTSLREVRSPRQAKALGLDPAQPRRRSVDFWEEFDVGDGFVASLRFMPERDGRFVVGELQVRPKDDYPGRRPREWRADVLGVDAWEQMPKSVRNGVTPTLLRTVPFGAHLKAARKMVEDLAKRPGWRDLAEAGLHVEKPEPRRRADRRPDIFYARLAAQYERLAKKKKRGVITELAERRGEKASRVRDAVHEARVRGLLTRSLSGRVGGQLTAKGDAVLKKLRKKK